MIDHKVLFDAACALKPIYDEQERIFQELLNTDCNVLAKNAEWEASVRRYQDALLSYAEPIAKATNNSTDGMRMMFRTDRLEILWTPADLLNAARYESFNSYAWKHPGASLRNDYTFPEQTA